MIGEEVEMKNFATADHSDTSGTQKKAGEKYSGAKSTLINLKKDLSYLTNKYKLDLFDSDDSDDEAN